ncbi:hypothetical protein B0H14DRAFT_3127130 [Mycena olivaceomarginata]|nr:hypothetical protein B0H14DRAFT_3127130 [Mycena olivaceomarginata]
MADLNTTDSKQFSIGNLPAAPRQMAIAAGGWSCDGVSLSIFTQNGGSIRQICLDRRQDTPGSTPNFADTSGWYNGSFQGTCAPWSALCCITLDGYNTWLFYQTEDNVIHQMQYEVQDWVSSSLNQLDAMPGTDMAVADVLLRLATNSTWAPAVRLSAAAATTPITATWSHNSFLLYFQDSTNQFREYRGGFDGKWVLQNSNSPSSDTLESVAVVSYSEFMGVEAPRVYTQDQSGSLTEWLGNGDNNEAWTPGTLGTVSALQTVNISAFAVDWMTSELIFLYWVDPVDRILRQRVWTQGWLSASPIGDALPTPDPLLLATEWISQGITVIGLENQTLSAAVQATSDELTADSALHLAAEAAIAGINVLAQSIEALSKVSGTSDNCKGQACPTNPRQVAMAAGGWSEAGVSIRIFTQNSGYVHETDDNVIHEMQYDGQNWTSSSLKQINAMPGTDMAVVYNDSPYGSYLMLFFQDSEGFVSSVLATNTKWAPAVHLFAAATATPITATQQSNAVFLYFQDSTKQLQQYRGSFDGGWVLQDFTGPTTSTLGSVAAVSWHSEPDIWGMSQAESRVYTEGQDGSLVEWNGNGNNETLTAGTMATVAALPNVNISAFSVGWLGLRLVFLYWVDPHDKILKQRVWMKGWLPAMSIGDPLLTFDALMAKCKGQSVAVAERFNGLHTKAHAILVEATNLSTEITYQQASIQSQLTRVADTQTLAQTKQTAVQQQLNTQKNILATEKAALQKVRDAESDYRTAHEVVNDLAIFFPFLATAAEFIISPALENALEVAGRAVDAATTNMASDQQAVDTTQKNYDAIQQEVASLTQLQTTLSAFGPVLESQAATASNMQTCTQTVDSNALDVGVFLGKLAGQASVLPFQDTAKILAQTVVAMQKLMKTQNQLTGIIIDDPQSIDPVLQAIAKSPVVPTAVDEMI